MEQYNFYDVDDNKLIGPINLGNNLPETYIGYEVDGTPVARVELDVPTTRRSMRSELFSLTIDKLNPVWYNSLTETQKSNLDTWRQAWLDYPTSTDDEPSFDLVRDIFTI